MCLPDFIEFKQIDESAPIIGYRNWRIGITSNSLILQSLVRRYSWSPVEGPHEVRAEDSGIYSYNNYNYNYNYNNYNNYNYNYNIGGIIYQFGKVAIHEIGYRSEYAKIKTLFTIEEQNAQGPQKFLKWLREFNIRIKLTVEKYNCDTISWQKFLEDIK